MRTAWDLTNSLAVFVSARFSKLHFLFSNMKMFFFAFAFAFGELARKIFVKGVKKLSNCF